ncbi:DUF3800 domain-containing protein [Glaesserella parasuis]|nr:DUF3800 domain-containing protein [Glaesserella parasuis]
MNIFIDESGNSGDLIKKNMDLNFAGQRIFVLSALKFDDNLRLKLENKVRELKEKYKINSNELKSTSLFKKKPEFILDLIVELAKIKAELFIEVVDKKFYICCSIVNHQIFPPYFTDDESDGSFQLQRNIISDYLTRHLTEKEFQAFANSCLDLNEENLNESWKALLDFSNADNNCYGSILVKHINETKDDYEILKKQYGIDYAIKRFVPIPDIGKYNQKIHLLPQISCLTNIIARINHGANLNEVKFLHDEQKHFDEIMLNNVELMKSLGDIDISFHYANFNVLTSPSVSFDNQSSDNLFIQISDMISGFIMRYVNKMINNEELENIYHEIFNLINILSQIAPQNGTGINFVMDRGSLSKLNVNVMSPMIIKDKYIADIYYDMNLARQELE